MAFCSQGHRGLILSETPVEVTYADGSKDLAWTGIHIDYDDYGAPWSSRNPVVLTAIREEAVQRIVEGARREDL